MTLFAFSLNLPLPRLTERVNLRHYIFCVPLKVPQRGENRSGFPSDHGKPQAPHAEVFVNPNNHLRFRKSHFSEKAPDLPRRAASGRKGEFGACVIV